MRLATFVLLSALAPTVFAAGVNVAAGDVNGDGRADAALPETLADATVKAPGEGTAAPIAVPSLLRNRGVTETSDETTPLSRLRPTSKSDAAPLKPLAAPSSGPKPLMPDTAVLLGGGDKGAPPAAPSDVKAAPTVPTGLLVPAVQKAMPTTVPPAPPAPTDIKAAPTAPTGLLLPAIQKARP